jgi:predicted esterase
MRASVDGPRLAAADGRALSRREALRLGAALAVGLPAALGAACRSAVSPAGTPDGPGRLRARPHGVTGKPVAPGLAALGLGSEGRDGQLYVPSGYNIGRVYPLVLMLHGAGGSGRGALTPFLGAADAAGLILVAPDSRGTTWDFIRGPYGPDVAFIDRALGDVFARCAVDPARMAIEGFSDGASYALSLGLTNGDLFGRVVAFSPCIVAPAAEVGRPRIFLSHGTADQVLPIEGCGRRVVAQLRARGYEVEYREFDGPHTVPADIARAASDWLAAP